MQRTLFEFEHEEFRASFRRWLDKEVVPRHLEWEDAGMDRLVGAKEAVQYVRRLAFEAPEAAFDAAFSSGE